MQPFSVQDEECPPRGKSRDHRRKTRPIYGAPRKRRRTPDGKLHALCRSGPLTAQRTHFPAFRGRRPENGGNYVEDPFICGRYQNQGPEYFKADSVMNLPSRLGAARHCSVCIRASCPSLLSHIRHKILPDFHAPEIFLFNDIIFHLLVRFRPYTDLNAFLYHLQK